MPRKAPTPWTKLVIVELSISGTSFTVRRKRLTEHDWMLFKLVDNETPWAIYHTGRYFLDVDPVAFRWILHYTRCPSLPSEITKSLADLEVIRTVADFLCFQAMVEYLDDKIAS
jgi:hypothetical protein